MSINLMNSKKYLSISDVQVWCPQSIYPIHLKGSIKTVWNAMLRMISSLFGKTQSKW